MKKLPQDKKLALHREAIRHLDQLSLTHVVGGSEGQSKFPNPCWTRTKFDTEEQ